jgi:hypothetical protein
MIDNGRESPGPIAGRRGYDTKEVRRGSVAIRDTAAARIVAPADIASTGRRTALAEWLASPENPLTPRVMVNRIWHYHFGRGIAGTPSDFGAMGERPINPALLDYLAATFVENGWSIKKMHRLIMLSNTYQESARPNPDAVKVDPEDRLAWRYNRHRLEGEAIRDSILEVSGRLNLKMGGPGVFPPLPAGVETRGGWKKDEEASEAERRSVYVFVRRNTRYPMFEVFDMPDTHESCPRRNATVTAPQALELLNNELVLDWSRSLAGRVWNDAGMTPEAQVDRAWRFVYARAAKRGARKRSHF